MKKARFLLSMIFVIMIITINFSFKATKFSTHFIYTGILGSGVCQTKTVGAAIICSNGFIPNVAASTTALAAGCPNVFTTVVID